MALREDQIANSVGFLTHPSVVSRSPQEKSDFLLQKGLSLDEIKEAFKRADAQLGRTSTGAAPAAAASPVAPTVIYQQLPAPEPPWWSSVLAPAALLLSAGTGLAYVYKTLVEPQLDPMQPPPLALTNDPLSQPPPPSSSQQQQPNGALPPWQQPMPQQQLALPSSAAAAATAAAANGDVQALRKAVEEQSSSIKDLVGSLKDVVTQLQDRAKQPDMLQVMMAMQGSGDIKAELASIKTLLLATHLQGRGGQLQHLTENGVGDMSALPLNLSAVEALTKATSPPPASAMAAAAASAQANPEEEKEREDAKRESEAIARGREALAKMNAQCQGDEDMVHACNMLVMFIRNVLKEPHIPRYRRIARSNAGFKKSLEPLEGHLQVLEAVGFEEKGATSLEMSPQFVESLESADGRQWARNALEDMVTNIDSVIAQRKAPPPAPPKSAPPPSPSPSSSDQPTYPTPFADVVRMQQQGITPPGIKTIPDKLSEDAPSKSFMQAPPKPWERGTRGAHVEILPDEPTSD